MRFSETIGRKVVSTDTAVTVGQVADYVLDAKAKRIAALVLRKTPGHGSILAWEDLVAFGEDAVIVASGDVVVSPSPRIEELANKQFAAHGKRVLNSVGVDLGAVEDVAFDESSGALHALVLDGSEVDADRLLAVGSYAVVVRT